MKKINLTICLFLFFFLVLETSVAQSVYTKTYYKSDMQSSTITSTIDDAFLISGYDYWDKNFLFKIDSLGDVIWSKQLEPVNSDYHVDIIPLKDSIFLFTTSYFNSDKGYSNLLCIVFNNNGDTLWSKEYDLGNHFLPYSACEAFDNGIVISGVLQHIDNPQRRIAIVKLDSTGTHTWTKIIAGGNHSNYGYSIKQTLDTNFILTGFIEDSDPFESFAFLTKLTPNGNIHWSKTYRVDSTEHCIGYDVYVSDDGYLIGSITSHDLLLIKTDFSGNVNWAYQYDIYSFNALNMPVVRIRRTEDDGFVLLAPDYLIKVDESGDLIWATEMIMYVSDVFEAQDNGFMVIGNGPVYGVKSPIINYSHIGLIKTDNFGFNDAYCVMPDPWVSVEERFIISQEIVFDTNYVEANTYTTDFQISDIDLLVEEECVTFLGSIKDGNSENQPAVFPNPSSGIFSIVASAGIINHVTIFNSTGKMISRKDCDSEKLIIDLSNNLAGIYLIQIKTTKGISVQKLMVY